MRSNRSSNIDGPVAGEYFSRVRLLYQLSGPWLRICVLSDPVGAPKWGSGRERGTGAYASQVRRARRIMPLGKRVQALPGNELLRDLPLELNAVGTLSGHGFHPLKAQLTLSNH